MSVLMLQQTQSEPLWLQIMHAHSNFSVKWCLFTIIVQEAFIEQKSLNALANLSIIDCSTIYKIANTVNLFFLHTGKQTDSVHGLLETSILEAVGIIDSTVGSTFPQLQDCSGIKQ